MKSIIFIVMLFISFTQVYAGSVLYIGRSSNEIEKENRRITPIAKYLSTKFKHIGIDDVKVKIDLKNSVASLLKMVDDDDLHLILESPYGISEYYKAGKADPILIISRKGKITQNTIFFSRNDSGINKLDDLIGKTIALEDRNSTTGYILPYKFLIHSGYALNEINHGDTPAPDKINYTFAESEVNITTWVNIRKIDAGVLNINDWENKKYNPDSFSSKCKIFAQTPEIITMFLSASNTLAQDKITEIKKVFLNMHKNRDGREALRNFRIDYFLELPENWEKYNEVFMK